MPQELRNNIKPVELLDVQEISAAKNGNIIDTHQETGQGFHFDTILVRAGTGGFGADIDGVKIKVMESDNANMSSSSVAKGGEEVEVGEDEQQNFQVQRTKRYIRVTATPVEVDSPSGSAGEDVALVYAIGILTNWAVPMPLIT